MRVNCDDCNSGNINIDECDEVVFHICLDCGHCVEFNKEDYYLSDVQSIEEFFKQYGYRIPSQYIQLLKSKGENFVLCLDLIDLDLPKNVFDEDAYEMDDLMEVKKISKNSIFKNGYLKIEWGISEEFVLFSGNGDIWLAFDYRKSKIEPGVAIIVFNKVYPVSNSFVEFMGKIIKVDLI